MQQNAQAYVPEVDDRARVAAEIRRVFACADRTAAEARLGELVSRHQKAAPKLAAWMEENIPEGLTVFALPAAHQSTLRTSNSLERVNQELKRRTRVARIFSNEASLLRLISARLMAISEDWETGKIYLRMPTDKPASNADV